jgi:hypothetical protein
MSALNRVAIAALAIAIISADASAQGNLSTQGLGFPPGQLSAASKSAGGGSGEVDPLSPLNPAAIGLVGSAIIYFQAEPEFRSVKFGATTNKSSIARFPLFMGAQPVGERWVVAVSTSTLLDRTWETSVRDSQVVVPDTIRETRSQRSDGSINDLRLAVSFAPAPWLRLGIGGHAYSGRTFLRTLRTFDNTSFSPDTQENTVGFGGNAISVGVQGYWPRIAAVGASFRKGGHLNAYAGDSVTGSGNVPDHIGFSAMYLGLSGSSFSVRAGKDKWSSVAGLAKGLNVHEGWDFGAGADVSGPRFGTNVIALRAGFSARTLPFSVNTTAVKEHSISGGFAIPLAQRRVELNVGATRATRTGSVGFSESSWTLISGFAIRP